MVLAPLNITNDVVDHDVAAPANTTKSKSDNNNDKPKKHRIQYCTAFKQKVVAHAVKIKNYRAAGRMYKVTHRMIRKWELSFANSIAMAMEQDTSSGSTGTGVGVGVGTTGSTGHTKNAIHAITKLLNSTQKKRLPGGGRKSLLSDECKNQLKLFVTERKEQNRSITVPNIVAEYIRFGSNLF